MKTAGLIATGLLGVLAVFQLAVAAGAPLGRWSWGGQHAGVLPMRYRVASGLAGLLLYPAMALTILGTAGLADNALVANRTAMWVLSGFFALGTVANFASRSKYERVWGPVSLGLAICCAVIALAL
jgi:hypothetical protein